MQQPPKQKPADYEHPPAHKYGYHWSTAWQLRPHYRNLRWYYDWISPDQHAIMNPPKKPTCQIIRIKR